MGSWWTTGSCTASDGIAEWEGSDRTVNVLVFVAATPMTRLYQGLRRNSVSLHWGDSNPLVDFAMNVLWPVQIPVDFIVVRVSIVIGSAG